MPEPAERKEPPTVSAAPAADPQPGSTAGWAPASAESDPQAAAPTVTRHVSSTPGPERPEQHTLSEATEQMPPSGGEPGAARLPQIPGFRVEQMIGRGGMGTVYRAVDLTLGRVVALKLINPGGRDHDYVQVRFEREVQALAAIEHENIVPIYHGGECHGFPYFTMKYVPGGPLSQHLKRFTGDPGACARLVAKVARAIQTLHEHKVVHRDLKPLNILLGEGDEPLVADFGLAKWLDDDPKSAVSGTGIPIGTRFYMAPEQTLGLKTVPPEAADIWALGVTLYELLGGSRPFQDDGTTDLYKRIREEEPPPLPGSVPAALAAVVGKCLAKNPGDRYPTAAAVADDLEAWLEGRPVSAKPVPPAPRSRRSRWRIVVIAVAALAALLVALALLGAFGSKPGGGTHDPEPLPELMEARAPAGQWQTLLTREPTPLRWPDPPGNSKRHYEAGNEAGKPSLTATCVQEGLVSIGKTSAASYEFELDIAQHPWSGGPGVFFGYADRELGGQPTQTWQTLVFTGIPGPDGSRAVRLDWKRESVSGPPGQQRKNSYLVKSTTGVLPLRPGEHRVRVAVGPKGLEGAYIDDARQVGLSASEVNKPPPADWGTGEFGIYLDTGSGVFSKARFIHHEVAR